MRILWWGDDMVHFFPFSKSYRFKLVSIHSCVMAPASVAQSIILYVTSAHGRPAGREDDLVTIVRQRLNTVYANSEQIMVHQQAFMFGVSPIVKYLQESFGRDRALSMDKTTFGVHLYKVLEKIATRTRLLRKHEAIVEDEDAWLSIEAAAQSVLRGSSALPPSMVGAPRRSASQAEWAAPARSGAPWWSKRYFISAFTALLSALGYQTRGLCTTSRNRVYVALYAFLVLVAAVIYFRHGPDEAFAGFLWTRATSPADEDGGLDEASEHSTSAPQTPEVSFQEVPEPVAADPALTALATQMQELRSLVQSMAGGSPPAGVPQSGAQGPLLVEETPPVMQTLLNFASEHQATGPISHTAAAQHAQATPICLEDYFPVEPRMWDSQNDARGWAPYAGSARTVNQAKRLLGALQSYKGQSQLNPMWGPMFWQSVARAESDGAFEPDLLRLLRAHGYQGAGTLGAPRDALQAALAGLRDAGSPAVGSGAFLPAAPGLEGMMADFDERWDSSLPPDLPRAGPEIYRALRGEGSACVRDWLSTRFKGEKTNKNAEWVDLWNAASGVDFAIAKNKHNILGFLASDDDMEVKLRRLASYVHFQRTGDLNSATQLLALKPPGTGTDIAPKWLLDEATLYSKNTWAQEQRVKGGGRKGKEPAPKKTPRKDPKGKGAGKGKDE